MRKPARVLSFHSLKSAKLCLASMIVVVIAVFCGCGGGAGSTNTTGVSTSQSGASVANAPTTASPTVLSPPTALSGTVKLRAIQVVPADAKTAVVSSMSQLTSAGYKVAPDGSLIVSPDSSAAGWTVEFGGQRVVTDVDGTFTLQPPTDGATSGILHHPSDSRISVTFTLDQLGKAKGGGGPIVIPQPFHGSCGMNASDTCCAVDCPSAKQAPRLESNAQDDGLQPTLFPWNDPREIADDNLNGVVVGTKAIPPRNGENPEKCPILDGAFGRNTPFKQTGLVAYLGSTCDRYIWDGSCPNENPMSDSEYALLLTGISVIPGGTDFLNALKANGEVTLNPPNVPSNQVIHCFENHKKRNCGMIVRGDVSCVFLDSTGQVTFTGADATSPLFVKAGGKGVVQVPPGQKMKFIIHNNGIYGITKIVGPAKPVGDLSGAGVISTNSVTAAGAAAGGEIHHFRPVDYKPNTHAFVGGFENPTPLPTYVTDEELTYTASTTEGAEDKFDFMVDDRKVTITFKAVTSGPYKVTVMDQISSNAEYGIHTSDSGALNGNGLCAYEKLIQNRNTGAGIDSQASLIYLRAVTETTSKPIDSRDGTQCEVIGCPLLMVPNIQTNSAQAPSGSLMNKQGDVFYEIQFYDGSETRWYLWDNTLGTSTAIPARPGTFIRSGSLNDKQQIVGIDQPFAGGSTRAFFVQGGVIVDLDVQGKLGLGSQAFVNGVFINNKEQIVGSVSDTTADLTTVFKIDHTNNNAISVLFTMPFSSRSNVEGWNDNNMVLVTRGDGTVAIWQAGDFTPKGGLGLTPYAWNNKGDVLGKDGKFRMALYSNGSVQAITADLLSGLPSTNEVLVPAAINDNGIILCYQQTSVSEYPILLTPVKPSTSSSKHGAAAKSRWSSPKTP